MIIFLNQISLAFFFWKKVTNPLILMPTEKERNDVSDDNINKNVNPP